MSRLLALYYEFRYRLRKWYWSRNAHDSRINGVVLMYHHISDVRMDELDTCQHTLEQFKKSLECYINQSYIFVNIDTALKMIREKSEQKFAVVTESKEILERLLGHPVDYLAYPFGRQSSISHKVMKQAEKAGYKCAFGTIDATINDLSSKSLYYLPRIVRK